MPPPLDVDSVVMSWWHLVSENKNEGIPGGDKFNDRSTFSGFDLVSQTMDLAPANNVEVHRQTDGGWMPLDGRTDVWH